MCPLFPQKDPSLLTPWPQTFSLELQDNICCLSHPVRGTFYGSAHHLRRGKSYLKRSVDYMVRSGAPPLCNIWNTQCTFSSTSRVSNDNDICETSGTIVFVSKLCYSHELEDFQSHSCFSKIRKLGRAFMTWVGSHGDQVSGKVGMHLKFSGPLNDCSMKKMACFVVLQTPRGQSCVS
jgi:hypothetical protein